MMGAVRLEVLLQLRVWTDGRPKPSDLRSAVIKLTVAGRDLLLRLGRSTHRQLV
jgi:hypothetical protein